MIKCYQELEDYQMFEGAGYFPVFHVQSLYAWDKDLNAYAPPKNYYVYNWSWN